jgi:uncharacterized protein with NRDE domain
MCIGIWSTEHPKYALYVFEFSVAIIELFMVVTFFFFFESILAANRDEFLSRPTADATFHSFGRDPSPGGEILSGRDLQAGGSWLGMNKDSGKLAFL